MKKTLLLECFLYFYLLITASAQGDDTLVSNRSPRFGISAGYCLIGRESILYSVSIDQPNRTLAVETYPVKGPYTFKAEYYVLPNLTVGFDLFYAKYKVEPVSYYHVPPITSGFKGNTFTAFLRANNYFKQKNSKEPIDFYVGLGIGKKYNKLIPDVNSLHAHYDETETAYEASVGFKIYILKVLGIYTEGGFSSSTTMLFNFGVTAKF